MKRILIITTLLLLLPVWARSQDGLHSQAVFDGKVVPKDRIVETLVKGEYLKDYSITLFHSIRMDVDEAELQRISSLVQEDARDAVSKEMEISHGLLSFALLALPPGPDGNRLLGFQSKPSDDGTSTSVIIVYLEGETTLTDLKKSIPTNSKLTLKRL